MYKYVVTIENERARYIDIISISIAVISAVCFLYQQLGEGSRSYLFLAAFVVIAAGLGRNWYLAYKKSRPVYYSIVLLAAGITWFAMPVLQWTGVLYLMLAFLERKARLNLAVGFSDENIVFDTLFKKKFNWSEFNNILLKDGMLTLDFRNNHLFQKVIIDKEGSAREADFNEYCRKQLAVSSTVS